MKKTKEATPELLEAIKSVHERALSAMLHDKSIAQIIPIHTAMMKVLLPDGNTDTIQTIIPEMAIYVKTKSQTTVARDAIEYRITYNNVPFPLAHVYGSSGYLCLGSVYVPPVVPIHSPQLPLETLFLYNDRVLSHGNPSIPLTNTQKQEISAYMKQVFPKFSNFDVDLTVANWVANDTLWRLGNYVLTNTETVDDAYNIMENVFKLIFTK